MRSQCCSSSDLPGPPPAQHMEVLCSLLLQAPARFHCRPHPVPSLLPPRSARRRRCSAASAWVGGERQCESKPR